MRWGARACAGRLLTYPTPTLLGAQRAALIEEHVAIDTAAGQVVEHESAGVKIGLPLGEQFSYFLCQSISVCGGACVCVCVCVRWCVCGGACAVVRVDRLLRGVSSTRCNWASW